MKMVEREVLETLIEKKSKKNKPIEREEWQERENRLVSRFVVAAPHVNLLVLQKRGVVSGQQRAPNDSRRPRNIQRQQQQQQ